MKLKYYMRGIGVGIVFTVLMFFMVQPETAWSEAKIIEEAKKLGMVEDTKDSIIWTTPKTTPSVSPVLTSTIEPANELTNKPLDETVNNQSVTLEPTDTISNIQSSPEPTNEPPNTPTKAPTIEPTDIPTNTPTIEPTDAPIDNLTKEPTPKEVTNIVTIKISQGMTSTQVAELLMDKGLIEDAKEFDDYLIDHEYAFNIREGTYIIKKTATYYDIAEKITR